MEKFRDTLGGLESKTVLDVGSFDVNGSYQDLFKTSRYVGVDITGGPNVNLVVEADKYPFDDNSFDIVICGQVLEHALEPKQLVKEMARVLKPAGQICIIAPWKWDLHRYPVDCWRFLPDGLGYLMQQAGLVVDSCFIDDCDCVGIGHK